MAGGVRQPRSRGAHVVARQHLAEDVLDLVLADRLAEAAPPAAAEGQPQIARLEKGDVNPSMDTLVRVAAGLGIELTINVTPAEQKPRLVAKHALTHELVGGVRTERAHVLVAAC